MYPLHPGHPGVEAATVLLLSAVVLAAALALTLEGWSRAGGLAAAGALAVVARVGLAVVDPAGSAVLHVAGHGLELGGVVALGLAGAAAHREGWPAPGPTTER